MNESASSVEFKETTAARMLSEGLKNATLERGLSRRSVAKLLGYKQSVVLSHMALGRVPIPVERAAQFAEILMLDKRTFLAAVLEQRYPEIDWKSMGLSPYRSPKANDLMINLELIVNGPLDHLTASQMKVMREVAADKNAGSRWLSVHEVPAMTMLRILRPDIRENGLSSTDRECVRRVLTIGGGDGA